jgi:hypothetical protein
MPGKATSIRSSDGGEFSCHLVVPETAAATPAIVLASPVHGVDVDIRAIADEFAARPRSECRVGGSLHVACVSKCEELNVSKSSPPCLPERTSMRQDATSQKGTLHEVAALQPAAREQEPRGR